MTAAPELANILRAGNLPVTDENLALLAAGLDGLSQLYPVMGLVLQRPALGAQKKALARLMAAAEAIAEVLDDDFEAGSGIEVLLDACNAPLPPELRVLLKRLPAAAAEASILQDQAHAEPPRRESAATFALAALHDLYAVIAGEPPGLGGPLRRFCGAAIGYLGLPVDVPEDDAFRLRLRAALQRRRHGPVNLLPIPVLDYSSQKRPDPPASVYARGSIENPWPPLKANRTRKNQSQNQP